MKGFTANPELQGESLADYCEAADTAMARLRRAGVGAVVHVSSYAERKHPSIVRKNARGLGKIIGFDGKWIVLVKPLGYKRAHGYHARFWEPSKRRS